MPGFYLKVDIGKFGGLGAARVHHDEAAGRVFGDLFQRNPRLRDAVGHPWVLAKEKGDLAVMEVAPRIEPNHLGRDPELPGLLLGKRVRAMDGAKGRAGCVAIDSRKVVTLASATVVEDCLAAVLFAQRGKTFRHFRDRSVPVNLFEAPVTAPT